jgi:hypothetical protein
MMSAIVFSTVSNRSLLVTITFRAFHDNTSQNKDREQSVVYNDCGPIAHI